MSATTLTLTAFLEARLAEDEAWQGCGGPDQACARTEERMWAEVAAKRRLIESDPVGDVRKIIATEVYADHPDYRPEWQA